MEIMYLVVLMPILALAILAALLSFEKTRKKFLSAVAFVIDRLWVVSIVLLVGLVAYKLLPLVPAVQYQLDEKYCTADSECYAYTHTGSPESATCNCSCQPSCINRKFQVSCKDTCDLVCFYFDQEFMGFEKEFTLVDECMCIDNQCMTVKNVTKACEAACNDVIKKWGCDAARLKAYEADYVRFGRNPPFSREYNRTWTENNCYELYNCSCGILGPEGIV